MGGKGGDSVVSNAAANSGPVIGRMTPGVDQPTSTADIPPEVVVPPLEPPTDRPTMGDDAKTPGGDGSSPPPVGDPNGTGTKTDTGSVAAQTLAAPSYWFNQPISTLGPKPIPKKSGSMKTTKTGGSV
ncbi:hypothetical protein ABIG06_006240 [Bradyrhizobium sp. USDA 326]|uniref:hypothetical protein n=1 Tax=unclassified Bradyrhizobium TaxID=2631580 RepID=UPI003511358D